MSGCDAIIVENMGDVPYLRGGVSPETVAAAALATRAVVELGAPVGVLGRLLRRGGHFSRVEAGDGARLLREGAVRAALRVGKGARAAVLDLPTTERPTGI